MVETVSRSTFNFSPSSSDCSPSYSFASTMRTCFANNRNHCLTSDSSSESSANSCTLNADHNVNARRSSFGEMCSRCDSQDQHHNNNAHLNKRCSNTITTTCVNSIVKTNTKPKLQLTTTTFEDCENNLLSSCTTQLSTPQSNGMISQKHQFNYENTSFGRQSSRNQSNSKQKLSESPSFYRRSSEMSDANNNNLLSCSFDDVIEHSNSSEDDLVFESELSSSPSQLSNHQHAHHQQQPKSPRQFGNNSTFVLCKRCGSSNSSLTSFSSISSSLSSTHNQSPILTNGTCCTHAIGNSNSLSLNPQDNLINLSNSLNQTFNFTTTPNSNNLTPQYGRSRHNSINSLTLTSAGNQPDRNLHALHKALHNIFSN